MPLLQRHHQQMLLLLLLLVVAAFHGDSSSETYDSSMCLSDSEPFTCGGLSFSYPFYLATERKELNGYQNSSCGYPGMGIVCDDDKPILQVDGGENYTVKSNDGAMATLADPEVLDNPCPRVDHNVTFAEGSWLDYPASTVDYVFFFLGCNFGLGLFQPDIDPITCTTFANYPGRMSFVLPNGSVPAGNWSEECINVIQVPVLKYDPVDPQNYTWGSTGYGEVLRQGFQVSWNNTPSPCKWCEESNGKCAYNQTGALLGCLCTNGQINDQNCSSVADNSTNFSPIRGASASANPEPFLWL